MAHRKALTALGVLLLALSALPLARADPPTASIQVDPNHGDAPLPVTFSLTAHPPASHPGSYIESWSLTFGDGAQTGGTGDPDGTQVPHTYQAAGDFDAVFTVHDNLGQHASDHVSIHVSPANLPPHDLVLAPSPSSGRAPLPVTFTLDGSDPDGSIASWALDFGDGQSTSGSGDPDGLQRTHTYAAGPWTARLTLTDDRGATASVTASVTATTGSNAAPTASLSASPSRGEAPLVAQLLPSAHDADGSIASWEVDFGDGARATGSGDPSGLALAHTYSAGSWTARLTATDNEGSAAEASASVTATTGGNLPPVASLRAVPDSGEAPLAVRFEASADDPDGGALTWHLDFGDGTPAAVGGARLAGPVNHTYLGPGAFTAVLTATDSAGATASARALVHVAPAPGVRAPGLRLAVAPSEGAVPLESWARIEAKPGFDRIASWEVDFGDGARASGLGDPSGLALRHTFDLAGRWEVRARLALDSGLVLEQRATVVAAAAAPPSVAAPRLSLEAEPRGSEVRFTATAAPPVQGTWFLDFGDGGALTLDTSGGLSVVHRYPKPGLYHANLTVQARGTSLAADTWAVVGVPLAAQSRADVALAPLPWLPLAGLALLAPRRTRAAGLVALLLGGAAMPLAEAHNSLRHTQGSAWFTDGVNDLVRVEWDARSEGPDDGVLVVIAPDGRPSHARGGGPLLEVKPVQDRPIDGTWSVAYAPSCTQGPVRAGFTLEWILGPRSARRHFESCTPAVWMWNWSPWIVTEPYNGTILLLGHTAEPRVDDREAVEPTFYTGAPPYYNLDRPPQRNPNRPFDMQWLDLDADGDRWPTARERLLNSHPGDERSRPDTDDDGDGVRNLFDDTPWWRASLEGWEPVAPLSLGELPQARADRLLAQLLHEVAARWPGAPLADGLRVASEAVAGEPRDAVWENALQTLRFSVENRRPRSAWPEQVEVPGTAIVSSVCEAAALTCSATGDPAGDGVVDVVLHVPEDAAGEPLFQVDTGATLAAQPRGWKLLADARPDGVHALWWTGGPLTPGNASEFRVIARAPRVEGEQSFAWRAETFNGSASAEMRVGAASVRALPDKKAPSTVREPAAAYATSPTVLRLVASDAGSGVATTLAGLDGAEPGTSRVLLLDAPADGINDGPHELRYRSVDRSGNEEAWHSDTIVVDTQPPSTALDAPRQPQPGPFTVWLNASDATSGVAAVRWRLWLVGEPRPLAAQEGSEVAIARDGRWTLEYAAEDRAGNRELPRIAALHLDGPDKLALRATPNALAALPGEPVRLDLSLLNLAGEDADAPTLRLALPQGVELVEAQPPPALTQPPTWTRAPLRHGASWDLALTLRQAPGAPAGSVAQVRAEAEARFAGVRSVALDVPLAAGELHRLDLACPPTAAADAASAARVVCLVRNEGNAPEEVAVVAPLAWRAQRLLTDEDAGWPSGDTPAPALLSLAPGAQRAVALRARGAGALEVAAEALSGARAQATVQVESRPLRGLLAEPVAAGVVVRNVGSADEALRAPLALALPAGAAQSLALGGPSRVEWAGPALEVAPRPLVGAQAPAAPLARPAIEGAVTLDGERAVVALRLLGLDGLPMAGAEVKLEDARATTDAAGRADLDVEARKLADGFTIHAGTPPVAWRFQPAVASGAIAWSVEVRPGGLEARLRGSALPDSLSLAARWLAQGDATEATLRAERFGDALLLAARPPTSAQEVELRAPAWTGSLALAGGGASGQLVRLEPASYRAFLRPAFATLSLQAGSPASASGSGVQPLVKDAGAEGPSWEVSVANRAKEPVRSVHWELLSASRASLAQGDVVPSDPRAETVQFRLRLPGGEPAAFLRLTVAFEGGLTAVLPEEALVLPSSRVPAAVARSPDASAFAALALLGVALLLERRRP